MEYLYSLTVALFLTIALIPLLIRVSGPMGLVDDATAARKVHTQTMPRTGGLGIIIGAGLPIVILLPAEGYLLYFFLGCLITVFFGLLDDRVELNFKWKLFGQALAAAMVMSGGIVVHQFPFFGLEAAPAWLTYPITFLFLVGVVNGVNFSDGLDGLAAGISIMALLLIFALSMQSGNHPIALISLTVIGGVLGFLRYNTFPANVFMGDAGSQFLGFVIACLAIAVTQAESNPYSTLLPVLILGIPIMDILQVVCVRIYKNLPWPGPDKEHFHHQLGKLGFRHVEVVAIIYVLQTILLGGAVLLRYESDFVIAAFYVVYVALVLGLVLVGNFVGWTFRGRSASVDFTERRNRYLRRLDWYYQNSSRVIALLLGGFMVSAICVLSEPESIWLIAVAFLVSLLAGLLVPEKVRITAVSRTVLYLGSVVLAYLIASGGPDRGNEYLFIVAYLSVMLVALLLAIRMTRKQEFSLTTQDLLILLMLLAVPLFPLNMMGQYEVGEIALIVGILMYTSEYVITQPTRMVNVAISGAVSVLAVMLLQEIF